MKFLVGADCERLHIFSGSRAIWAHVRVGFRDEQMDRYPRRLHKNPFEQIRAARSVNRGGLLVGAGRNG